MAGKHAVGDIRNLALVGHGAAGKTSLADALLFKAGAVTRRGSVDDGTSYSDYDDEEHKRHFSIDTSVLHADYDGKFLEILDAPGYPDFVGAALEALNASENAVIVVNAGHGIEVNTRRMFREATDRGLGRIVVLNKLDADNIDFGQLVSTVQRTFGKQCVLLNAPLGVGAAIHGVVGVIDPPSLPPADCPVDLTAARTQLIDSICECDDALMEKYLGEGDLSSAEIVAALPRAIAGGCCVPMLCTCAKKDIGVPELLDALARYTLGPEALPHVGSNGKAVEHVKATDDGQFVGQVFKTLSDKFVGNLSFVRVYSGKLAAQQKVVNLRSGKAVTLGGLQVVQGKQLEPVPEAVAGDIVALAKVEDLHIGDTLAAGPSAEKLPLPRFPEPMFGLAVEPKARGDEQKISTSLHKIADEDPTFRMSRDAQTHELVITGVSQLHLDVIRNRLKKRFDLEIVTHEPKIPYRETITTSAEADHRHKKQTGGRGQFGEVHLRVYPIPREIKTQQELEEKFANKSKFEKLRNVHYDPDYNFAFLDHIVGGTIPTQYIPAVEKGCRDLLDRGGLAGYRMQDVAVE
ncbi:MAG TPA: elongation factor G, partial [Gemmataceae bacterium]|nr:elongation factor G [Gemmataceae bacterium]